MTAALVCSLHRCASLILLLSTWPMSINYHCIGIALTCKKSVRHASGLASIHCFKEGFPESCREHSISNALIMHMHSV